MVVVYSAQPSLTQCQTYRVPMKIESHLQTLTPLKVTQ